MTSRTGAVLEGTLFVADALRSAGELSRAPDADGREVAAQAFKQAMASGVESQLCKALDVAGSLEGGNSCASFSSNAFSYSGQRAFFSES